MIWRTVRKFPQLHTSLVPKLPLFDDDAAVDQRLFDSRDRMRGVLSRDEITFVGKTIIIE
jgi:hypothetical protein